MEATVYAVKCNGRFYTHDYPSGKWNAFPNMQIYQTKGAASRQANKMPDAVVVELTVKET